MVRFVGLGLVCVSLWAGQCTAAEAPPNIVLIVSDDHGADDYTFRGHPQIRTPHLDRLAKESLVYPNGRVPTSLCCPSLAALLTGKYPHQTKITMNDPPKPAGKKPAELNKDPEYQAARRSITALMAQSDTLPRLLKTRGYVSFQTGKWWHGHFQTGGFTHGMSHGDPSKGGRHGDAGLTIGRQTMQPIFDFIQEAKKDKKPFFVWYAPMLPHQPHNPPDRILGRYRADSKSLFVAKYEAMVEWFDETCGTLLHHLADQGLNDNTLIIYVTDNGWIQNPTANSPIRSKLTPYDAGHRTPIMVRWPGKVTPAISPIPVSSIDIAPTILKAVGLPVPSGMAGIDLRDRTAVENREAVFGECYSHDAVKIEEPKSSLRHRWVVAASSRLIVPQKANVPDGKIELYDLAADPGETKNLADRDPDRVARLQKLLDAWWTP